MFPPVRAFTKAPAGWSHTEAATLTCAGLTAWRGLVTDGRPKPGDTVLIQGTGGVSTFALQFAKAAGAMVIATSSSDEKLERLRTLGADHVINYRQTPEWGLKAKEITAAAASTMWSRSAARARWRNRSVPAAGADISR